MLRFPAPLLSLGKTLTDVNELSTLDASLLLLHANIYVPEKSLDAWLSSLIMSVMFEEDSDRLE